MPSPTPKPTKRARPGRPKDEGLAARRRAEIVRHAVTEFAKRGYNGADLDAVAASAGCSKGTLYNYFDSKGDLFNACVDYAMGGVVEATDADDDGDPIGELESLVRRFLKHFAEHPEYVELLVQERSDFRDRKEPSYHRYREAKRERWIRWFRKLMEQGKMRRMPPEHAIDALGNLLYGAIFLNYFRGRRTDPAKQADELLSVLLGGLLTERAWAERVGKQK